MIKAVMHDRHGKMLILGLSRKNMELLSSGKPILVDGEKHGVGNVRILIMAGETELTLIDDLKRQGLNLPTPTIDPDGDIPPNMKASRT